MGKRYAEKESSSAVQQRDLDGVVNSSRKRGGGWVDRTVGKHVVDEPVVVVHAVFVEPPDPICILFANSFRGRRRRRRRRRKHVRELKKMREQERETYWGRYATRRWRSGRRRSPPSPCCPHRPEGNHHKKPKQITTGNHLQITIKISDISPSPTM